MVTSLVLDTVSFVVPEICTRPCFASAVCTVTLLASVMLSLRIMVKSSCVPSLNFSIAFALPHAAVAGMFIAVVSVISLSAMVPSLSRSMPKESVVPSVGVASGSVNVSPRSAENTSVDVASVAR